MEATDEGAAESSQADRIAVDRRHKLPGAVCFEPHVRAEPGAENRRRNPRSPFCGSAQARLLKYEDEWD